MNKKTGKLSLITNCRKQPLICFLVVCILITTCSKLVLLGEGYYSSSDEWFYRYSLMFLYELSNLNFPDAITYLFSTHAKPGEVLLKIIPAVVQLISSKIFHLRVYEPSNMYPLFFYNFIIYCLLLIVHYKFSKLLLKNQELTLFSVLLFGLLTNTYIYIQYAIPFDASLLILYFITYSIVKHTNNDTISYKKSFFWGALAFFGYLVYPGYFPVLVIIGSLLFFNKLHPGVVRKKIRLCLSFVAGNLVCLSVFEALSRIGNYSYLEEALKHSKTIVSGSFEESFIFLIKYLFIGERFIGIIFLSGLVIFYFLTIKNFRKSQSENSTLLLLGIVITVVYLIYSGMSYFFHTMVWYARLLHQFFPFICIIVVWALGQLCANSRWKNIMIGSLSLLLIANFSFNLYEIKSLNYVRDIAWDLHKRYDLTQTTNIAENKDVYVYDLPEMYGEILPPMDKTYTIDSIDKDFVFRDIIVTNCCYYYYHKDTSHFHFFHPPVNYELTESYDLSELMVNNFEGVSPEQRRLPEKYTLKINVYERKKE